MDVCRWCGDTEVWANMACKREECGQSISGAKAQALQDAIELHMS